MDYEQLVLLSQDVAKAIAVEQRTHYTNIQGKKLTFGKFILQSLEQLKPVSTPLLKPWQRYALMGLAERRMLIEQLETFFQQQVQPKASTSVPAHTTGVLALAFDSPVGQIKGVGQKAEQALNAMGVLTVKDLLYRFPRRYIDYQQRVKIKHLLEGSDVTVIAAIRSVSSYQTPKTGMNILSITLEDETGLLEVTRFMGKGKQKQSWLESLKKPYQKGLSVMVSGKVRWNKYVRRMAIDSAVIEILGALDAEDSLHAGRIVPVYLAADGVSVRQCRQWIAMALEALRGQHPQTVPEVFVQRYALVSLETALAHIHFPPTLAEAEQARKRLVFDELFAFQCRLARVRRQYQQSPGVALAQRSQGLPDQLLASLPFALTGAQKRAYQEIATNMAHGNFPMYRLLQGDVGSGKTLVALLTLLTAIDAGYQGALMAPTEILAEQHYQNCVQWLTPLGVSVGLLLGKFKAKARREVLAGLANGQLSLIIGTHALIQEAVVFDRLGVAVIDEQHRFGVRQRSLLKNKGEHPHLLTMTATPIPRSLAMTVHGDMDVSILDELPPGRTPIETMVLPNWQSKKLESLVREHVAMGHQVYIVFPLIDESETLSAKAATAEYQRLSGEVFPEFRMGLLHGKLDSADKEAVMHAFASGQTQVLVTTTVIEVGVDVPNATLMIIADAERFGLAQLHQLRGRVGRGVGKSVCLLLSDSPAAQQRLAFLASTTDGFAIAEYDLQERGPGEFLGTRQSGLPDLLLTNLVNDQLLITQAREAAQEAVTAAVTADVEALPEDLTAMNTWAV